MAVRIDQPRKHPALEPSDLGIPWNPDGRGEAQLPANDPDLAPNIVRPRENAANDADRWGVTDRHGFLSGVLSVRVVVLHRHHSRGRRCRAATETGLDNG